MCVNWQICIEGSVEKLSDEAAESYFHSRPRMSQFSACVSNQSSAVTGRQVASSIVDLVVVVVVTNNDDNNNNTCKATDAIERSA